MQHSLTNARMGRNHKHDLTGGISLPTQLPSSRRNRNARDLAYEDIRGQILTMELEPGSRIDEVSLATAIGASRTPVREALHQLATEDLVTIMPRGGYQVSSMDIQKFHHVIDMQMLVARAATHRLVQSADETDFDTLQEATDWVDQAIAAEDSGLIAQRNNALHTLEVRLCGNPFFTQFAETIYTHAERFASLSFGGHQRFRDDLAKHYDNVKCHHEDYLKALRHRDLAAALSIAEAHVLLFRDRVLMTLSETTMQDVDVTPPETPQD